MPTLVERRRELGLFLLLSGLVVSTRLPLAPQQLFSFDEVNFAYAMGHFDPRVSQPQPPGYPLFVLQTRVLRSLGFKRPESNLIALELLGSVAALLMVLALGDRMFGRPAGFVAALLLLTEPSFWYTALTSAVRVQLAVVSLAVGLLCHRAWSGETRFVHWSALAVGIGSGIRPESGPLLVPLWIAAAARSGAPRKRVFAAIGVMAGAVLAWLVPAALASGGFASYYRMLAAYGHNAAGGLTSGLFGADPQAWLASVSWLLVWLFCGALACPVVLVLAWRRGEGFGFPPQRLWFLGLWFLPAFLFAALFHVADPGHVQSMTPVVNLVVGGLLARAATLLAGDASPLRIALLAQLPVALIAGPVYSWFRQGWSQVGPYLIAAPLLAAALAWIVRRVPGGGAAPRWLWIALLLCPVTMPRVFLFFFRTIYYTPRDSGVIERLKELAFAGVALSSFPQVRGTVYQDDAVLASIRRLAAGGRNTVVIWSEGPTSWRKAAYYLRGMPVVALESPQRLLARTFEGARIVSQAKGPAPVVLDLPARGRVVWLVDARKPFLAALRKAFPLTQDGHVYYHDLPEEPGSRAVEQFLLRW